MDLLLHLNRSRGMTLVVSLHDVSLARRYCERAIALRDGVLVHDGPTSELTPALLERLYGVAAGELQPERDTAPAAPALAPLPDTPALVRKAWAA